MFTPEMSQTKSDYFDHYVPSVVQNKMNSLVSSTFLSPTPSNYSDSGSHQQSPLNIYNNYNPNYHHHHYYFHGNIQDYGYNQQPNYYDSGTNWMRKYDYENQKEYLIAHTSPTPSECDFEVPQRVAQSPKPTEMKLFNDLDKIFFDDHKVKDHAINSCEAYSFWENENLCSEKEFKKSRNIKEKLECKSAVKLENKFSKASKRIAKENEGE
jgi:hypothetical protein